MRVLREALLVALFGALLAWLANSLSPRGLVLTRNYFPGTGHVSAAGAINPANTNLSPFELLAARFKEEGLQLADSNKAIQLFHDPRAQQELVVFIDARTEAQYQHGHIPGAWYYDYVRHENYLPTVGPACMAAQEIIVYCGGGHCEFSEHAAIDLRDVLRLPKEKFWVYAGGYTEWTNNRMPVEIGERRSGKIVATPE